MDADGTNPRQLVDEVVRNPVWSPDGTRIAFHKGGAREPADRGPRRRDLGGGCGRDESSAGSRLMVAVIRYGIRTVNDCYMKLTGKTCLW